MSERVRTSASTSGSGKTALIPLECGYLSVDKISAAVREGIDWVPFGTMRGFSPAVAAREGGEGVAEEEGDEEGEGG